MNDNTYNHDILTHLEKQRPSKPNRTSALIFLLCIVAAGHFEGVVVDCIYLTECLLHLLSCSFIFAKHTSIVAARWVGEVCLHLVVPLLVHNQHQRLRLFGRTVEIMS